MQAWADYLVCLSVSLRRTGHRQPTPSRLESASGRARSLGGSSRRGSCRFFLAAFSNALKPAVWDRGSNGMAGPRSSLGRAIFGNRDRHARYPEGTGLRSRSEGLPWRQVFNGSLAKDQLFALRKRPRLALLCTRTHFFDDFRRCWYYGD